VDPLAGIAGAGLASREQRLARVERELCHVSLPGSAVLDRRRHDSLLERGASAIHVALLLPRETDEAPESRRLAGRQPSSRQGGGGLALDHGVLLALPERIDPIRRRHCGTGGGERWRRRNERRPRLARGPRRRRRAWLR